MFSGPKAQVAAAIAGLSIGAMQPPAASAQDARKENGASSLVTTDPARESVEVTIKENGASSLVTTDPARESVEVTINGKTAKFSMTLLPVLYPKDGRHEIPQLGKMPADDLRFMAGGAVSDEHFRSGRIAVYDVASGRMRTVGALVVRDTPERSYGAKALVDGPKRPGVDYTGAAIAMHSETQGVLLLQMRDDDKAMRGPLVSVGFEIPKGLKPNEFREMMPQLIAPMLKQIFDKDVSAPGATATNGTPGAAAPAAAPSAAPSQPGTSRNPGNAVASVTAAELQKLEPYEVKYNAALNGELPTANSRSIFKTAPTADKENQAKLNLLQGYEAGLAAIVQGAKLDRETLFDARNIGVVTDDAKRAAVRLGMTPEEALNLDVGQLEGLIAKAVQLFEAARERDRLIDQRQNEINRRNKRDNY